MTRVLNILLIPSEVSVDAARQLNLLSFILGPVLLEENCVECLGEIVAFLEAARATTSSTTTGLLELLPEVTTRLSPYIHSQRQQVVNIQGNITQRELKNS